MSTTSLPSIDPLALWNRHGCEPTVDPQVTTDASRLIDLRNRARELCEDQAEFDSLVADCKTRFAVANPGRMARRVTWAYEMVYWQRQVETLSLRAEQDGVEDTAQAYNA